MKLVYTLFREAFLLILFLCSLFVLLCAALTVYLTPQLPDVKQLNNYKLQTPLKIYTSDGLLITEYGNQRRTPLEFREIPPLFTKALMAVEDKNFADHFGVDPTGFARAATCFLRSGNCGGGSTLTQQVAKNVFLTRDQTFKRKFTEIILALKMEAILSKEEIFELYVNKHFLGHRAYGIEAAANVYYNRSINDLTLAELAMIAGLNQSPSRKNPFSNPSLALERRNLVLKRMFEEGYISQASYDWAAAQPITAKRKTEQQSVEALYAAEEVRTKLYEELGERLYEDGYNVFTTVDSRLQQAANYAVRDGLLDYSERHGFKGAVSKIEQISELSAEQIAAQLNNTAFISELSRAAVIDNQNNELTLVLADQQKIKVEQAGWQWARPYIDVDNRGDTPSDATFLNPGDVVYVRQEQNAWRLAQPATAQGALVSLNPYDGAIKAIVGGYDYNQSAYNRATQAKRQPGSNIKPFIYAAALEKGYSAASLINDAPTIFADDKLETNWRPKNSGNKYLGEIPLRQALYQSRNASSVRILTDIGINYALDYLARIGFDTTDFAKDLSMILGTNELSPLEVATGYALFANGGYRVEPYLIQRIEDHQGNVIVEHQPKVACQVCLPSQQQATQVMNSDTAFIMDSILKDVITRGTATRARELKRNDIAGKTGTTNSQIDAWFTGYQPTNVTATWVGFDNPTTLGAVEFGGRAALPIWISYMKAALNGEPEQLLTQPAGIVRVKIDPDTALLATDEHENARFEWFRQANVPTQYSDRNSQIILINQPDVVINEPTEGVADNNSENATETETGVTAVPTLTPTPKVEVIQSPDLLF